MPVVSVKGVKFKIRWNEEWDAIILAIGKTPRYNKTKYTDWKKAVNEGAFNLLPKFITVDNVRRRATELRNRENPGWVKKQLDRNKKFYANRALKPNGHVYRIKRLRKLAAAGIQIKGETLREKEQKAKSAVSSFAGIKRAS